MSTQHEENVTHCKTPPEHVFSCLASSRYIGSSLVMCLIRAAGVCSIDPASLPPSRKHGVSVCKWERVCVSARMCSGSCMMEDAEMEPRWCESPLPSCIWSFIRLRSLSLSPPFGILTNPLAITLRPLLSFVPAGTNMPFGWRISSPSKTLI